MPDSFEFFRLFIHPCVTMVRTQADKRVRQEEEEFSPLQLTLLWDSGSRWARACCECGRTLPGWATPLPRTTLGRKWTLTTCSTWRSAVPGTLWTSLRSTGLVTRSGRGCGKGTPYRWAIQQLGPNVVRLSLTFISDWGSMLSSGDSEVQNLGLYLWQRNCAWYSFFTPWPIKSVLYLAYIKHKTWTAAFVPDHLIAANLFWRR